MTGNLKRRVNVLDRSRGHVGLGELLDVLDAKAVNLNDAATWPAAWNGRSVNPEIRSALSSISMRAGL